MTGTELVQYLDDGMAGCNMPCYAESQKSIVRAMGTKICQIQIQDHQANDTRTDDRDIIGLVCYHAARCQLIGSILRSFSQFYPIRPDLLW